jgi:hypothetical protein
MGIRSSVRSRHERVICQFVPLIRCMNEQVFVRVSIFDIRALISTMSSFAGENVHDKWLLIAMAIIKVKKGLW